MFENVLIVLVVMINLQKIEISKFELTKTIPTNSLFVLIIHQNTTDIIKGRHSSGYQTTHPQTSKPT